MRKLGQLEGGDMRYPVLMRRIVFFICEQMRVEQVSRATPVFLLVLVLLTVSRNADAKDAIEIVDIFSGATQSIECVINADVSEEFLACHDTTQCVYTLKSKNQNYSLRRIAYNAGTVEETALPDFSTYQYGRGGGLLSMCALSPSGEILVTFGTGRSVYLYSVKEKQKKAVIAQPVVVSFLFWVSDTVVGMVTNSSAESNEDLSAAVLLYDVDSERLEAVYKSPALNFGADFCTVSPGQRFLAMFCSSSNDLRILDLNAKKIAETRDLKDRYIRNMCWSLDGRCLSLDLEPNSTIETCFIDADGRIVNIKSTNTNPIVWGTFFLDSNRLACVKGNIVEKSGKGGPKDYWLEILDVSSGEWQDKLPYSVNERVTPIDNGKKLFMVVSDGHNRSTGRRK